MKGSVKKDKGGREEGRNDEDERREREGQQRVTKIKVTFGCNQAVALCDAPDRGHGGACVQVCGGVKYARGCRSAASAISDRATVSQTRSRWRCDGRTGVVLTAFVFP